MLESGSCGVGLGSMVFWGALMRTISKNPSTCFETIVDLNMQTYRQESLLGSEGHIHLDGVPVGSVHTIHQAPCEFSFVDLERKLNSKSFKADVTFLFVPDWQSKVTSKEAQARPDGEDFSCCDQCPMMSHATSTGSHQN